MQLSAGYEGSVVLSLGPAVDSDPASPLGELVVPITETVDNNPVDLLLEVSVEVDGSVKVEIQSVASKQVLSSLEIGTA